MCERELYVVINLKFVFLEQHKCVKVVICLATFYAVAPHTACMEGRRNPVYLRLSQISLYVLCPNCARTSYRHTFITFLVVHLNYVKCSFSNKRTNGSSRAFTEN